VRPLAASEATHRALRRQDHQELERVERAEQPAEADQAARRADKAAYLKEKLREQADADVD
jgi:hypothetical protein